MAQDKAWANIGRDDLSESTAQALEVVLKAMVDFEALLLVDAQDNGQAKEGDTLSVSYRSVKQGVVGVAVNRGARDKASGWGALSKPARGERQSLADYQSQQGNSGRRF